MKKRMLLAILLVILLIATGFLREKIFVTLNAILYDKYYHAGLTFPKAFDFFVNQNYMFVYKSKWTLTAVFVLIYYLEQWFFIRRFFGKDAMKHWLLFMYIIMIGLSIITYFGGSLIDKDRDGYLFSRVFMGILQSPLPLMFLVPVYYFGRKINSLK